MTAVERASDYLPATFKQVLVEGTRVKDIAPRWPNVIVAQTDETIASVFKKLIDNSILSLPLLDITTSKYIAFIDMFDILAYVVDVLRMDIKEHEKWVLSNQFQHTSCVMLPNRSLRNPWVIVAEDAPLQGAINTMVSSGAYRLAVVDSMGRFSSVLSQSRLVRFLANRNLEMGSLGDFSVQSLGLGTSGKLVTIRHDEKILNAFMKIYEEHVSGVGVLDDNGRIVGNISVSDLKDVGFTGDMFGKVYETAKVFLRRKIEGLGIPKLVWTYNTSPLRDVLYRLRANGIHRVYIVNTENMYPRGVVTLSDILTLFATCC